jgi:hypothetical protein
VYAGRSGARGGASRGTGGRVVMLGIGDQGSGTEGIETLFSEP